MKGEVWYVVLACFLEKYGKNLNNLESVRCLMFFLALEFCISLSENNRCRAKTGVVVIKKMKDKTLFCV